MNIKKFNHVMDPTGVAMWWYEYKKYIAKFIKIFSVSASLAKFL